MYREIYDYMRAQGYRTDLQPYVREAQESARDPWWRTQHYTVAKGP